MHHSTDFDVFVLECAKATSFTELVPIAIAELKKFHDGAEIVCGPISTGGRGSFEKNFEAFGATIRALRNEGRPIFSQVPYEERIAFFRKQWIDADPARAQEYFVPILEEFYLPIFQTGLINRAWFIPGWESSYGARWEREQLQSHGAIIEDLPPHWCDQWEM